MTVSGYGYFIEFIAVNKEKDDTVFSTPLRPL